MTKFYPIFVKLPPKAKPGSWLYFRVVTNITAVTRTRRTLTQIITNRIRFLKTEYKIWRWYEELLCTKRVISSQKRNSWCPYQNILQCQMDRIQKHITLHSSLLILRPPFFTRNPTPSILHSASLTFILTVEVGVWHRRNPSSYVRNS
jgi:hypothetical protein